VVTISFVASSGDERRGGLGSSLDSARDDSFGARFDLVGVLDDLQGLSFFDHPSTTLRMTVVANKGLRHCEHINLSW
jgi:hypothetical protein